jgi:hypothetical protein
VHHYLSQYKITRNAGNPLEPLYYNVAWKGKRECLKN